MNDLGYGQSSNPNQSLMFVLMHVFLRKYIENFFDISISLAKDFFASHFLSQSPQIMRADDPIMATQLSSRTSCRIQYVMF